MLNIKLLKGLGKTMEYFESLKELTKHNNEMLSSFSKQFDEYYFDLNQNLNLTYFFDNLISIKIKPDEILKAIDVSNDIYKIFRNIPNWTEAYSEQIQNLTSGLSVVTKRIAADLSAINLSAFDFSSLGIFDKLGKLVEYHRDSVAAFKSAGWPIAPSMDRKLRERIVLLHQQNRIRYASRVILGYYHKNNYKKLKNAVVKWNENQIFNSRMHIFNAALEAHCNRSYVLSVPTLYPQIEGVLNEFVKTNGLAAKLGKIKEVYCSVIGDLNDYPIPLWAIATTLLYQLQTNTYNYTDFEAEFKKSSTNRQTTRHTLLHGIATKYDKPINSLRAFVLLDALSALQKPNSP